MSQENYILSHQIFMGIEFLFNTVFMAAFFHPFLRDEKKTLRRNLSLIFLVNGIGYLLYLLPEFNGKLHMAAVTLVLMAFSGFLGMERKFIFLLGAVFYSIKNLSMIIMRSADFFLDKWILKDVNTAELIFLKAFGNYLLVTALQYLLFFLMLRIAGKLLLKKEMRLHARELCYLLLTPAMGILFVNIILRLLIVVNGNRIFQLFETFPVFTVILPAMAALIYAGTLTAIASCQKILSLQEEREGYFVARQQLSAMQNRIREAEGIQEELRRMRHELKNHLTTIRGLAVAGHYEDMESYISRMDKSLKALDPVISTGNAVTDVILNDRRKAAEEQNTDFQAEFSYPEDRGYNAYDMGIILGNLLQNALEACSKVPEGSRYISVCSRVKKKFFLLEVCNSFQGDILLDKSTNLPVSTKDEELSGINGFSHGIGLSNVKRTAEKYGGSLEIRTEGNTFCVTVLLQQCSTKKTCQ